MSRPTSCEAYQQGDEMHCGRCGTRWDVMDLERPACASKIDKRAIPTRSITRAVQRLEEAAPTPGTKPATLNPYGCHSKPRPVAGAVTHYAPAGYTGVPGCGPAGLTPIHRPIYHVMTTECKYDRSAADSRCNGCPWALGGIERCS